MRALMAGYWTGEFGWELMAWQAKLRHLAKSFENVVVGCKPGYEYIYGDFANDFICYSSKADNLNMWLSDGNTYPLKSEHLKDCTHIEPSREFCLGDHYKSKFVKYGSYQIDKSYHILIHARSTENYKTGYRNYPLPMWKQITEYFGGAKIACIGSKDGADYLDGTDDLRGIELDELCDYMASSDVLLSPSSGPAHLASLCKLSHVVWSDTKQWGIGRHNNRDRYKTLWNPFKTQCEFIASENWKPNPREIIKRCEKILHQS